MIRAFYERRVLPRLIDWACSQDVIEEQRRALIPQARGRVLEIGVGTGLNLPLYDRARVTEVVGAEPARVMHEKARRRAARAGLPLTLLAAPAEDLPLPGASFDTAVTTYTLCSVGDPLAALKAVRRVLKPGGVLLFAEHGLAPDASVRRWQGRLDRAWPAVAGGCHLTRDVPALLRAASFHIERLRAQYLRGPRPWTYHYSGQATPAP